LRGLQKDVRSSLAPWRRPVGYCICVSWAARGELALGALLEIFGRSVLVDQPPAGCGMPAQARCGCIGLFELADHSRGQHGCSPDAPRLRKDVARPEPRRLLRDPCLAERCAAQRRFLQPVSAGSLPEAVIESLGAPPEFCPAPGARIKKALGHTGGCRTAGRPLPAMIL
jgi:hypothetical protein